MLKIEIYGRNKKKRTRNYSVYRVIGAEGNVQSNAKVSRERVLVIIEKELIVGQGGHGNADLGEIVQILQGGIGAQKNAVIDLVSEEVGSRQMLYIPRLATMGTELKGIKSFRCTELVKYANVGVHVVHVVAKGRIISHRPIVCGGQHITHTKVCYRIEPVLNQGIRLTVWKNMAKDK